MTALLLFSATFVTVFAMGFQSQNVNGGHYIAAATTSLAIGTGNLAILKMIPDTTDPLMIASYLLAGPLGILASMVAHRRTLGKRPK